LVGASGVTINTTLLYVLTEASGLNYLVAAVFSTEAAILNNFLLNDRWTFSDVEPVTSWYRRALRYNCVALVGLAVSVSVLAALTYLLNMHYLLANLYAIGAGTLWNYTGSSYLTWATLKFNTPSITLLVVPLIWCRRLVALVLVEVNKLWT
jgi:dolichol-phosphate mannosyltransferase